MAALCISTNASRGIAGAFGSDAVRRLLPLAVGGHICTLRVVFHDAAMVDWSQGLGSLHFSRGHEQEVQERRPHVLFWVPWELRRPIVELAQEG